jgi:hypothetical protein
MHGAVRPAVIVGQKFGRGHVDDAQYANATDRLSERHRVEVDPAVVNNLELDLDTCK